MRILNTHRKVIMNKQDKFKKLYKFEKTHTKKGILTYNNKEAETFENLINSLTEAEHTEYEKEYYGI